MTHKAKPINTVTSLIINSRTQGETIETKVKRAVHSGEPIKDGAPILYTERKKGVLASTNIRTDRFEVAIEAMDKVAKSYSARRDEKANMTVSKSSDEPTDSSQQPKKGEA